jgi:predicted dithiol-disulfide oxidoreductase (DUF899 family)
MASPTLVSNAEWLKARKELLNAEKAFSHARDELTRQRQQLPWVKVEKEYVFEGPTGLESLSDLFDGRSQLIVYHFMFGPDWEEGCKACSFLADHFERAIVHLNHRDVTLVAVARGPLVKLEAFKKRMDWTFTWVSSESNDFNWDYHVSFTPEEKAKNEVYYNFGRQPFFSMEGPGLSVFVKDNAGVVYHTYSTYARGLENLITTYDYLDLVPKGRNEDDLQYGMQWVRFRDRYED